MDYKQPFHAGTSCSENYHCTVRQIYCQKHSHYFSHKPLCDLEWFQLVNFLALSELVNGKITILFHSKLKQLLPGLKYINQKQSFCSSKLTFLKFSFSVVQVDNFNQRYCLELLSEVLFTLFRYLLHVLMFLSLWHSVWAIHSFLLLAYVGQRI